MQDLKDVTMDVHYETYRAKHIAAQMTNNQRERRYGTGNLSRFSVLINWTDKMHIKSSLTCNSETLEV